MALGMSVCRAQQEIDSAEFAEWIAYDRMDPYGPERLDLHAGIVASTIASVNAGKGQTFRPSDFMPNFNKLVKRQSVAQMRANFALFAKAHNGSIGNGKATSTN